jgi:hypothetical protein
MTRRRTIIPQRAPIFIGGEGQSEIAYAGWLRNLIRDRSLPFHLELCDLGRGAGDPLSRIEMAIERLKQLERNREPYAKRYLFLDTDQLAAQPGRAEQARRLAFQNELTVIWQKPTHEAFLLRHLPGCHDRLPPDKRSADQALVKEWADYRKPCTSREIERRLDLEGASQVASTLPELRELLCFVGLLVS